MKLNIYYFQKLETAQRLLNKLIINRKELRSFRSPKQGRVPHLHHLLAKDRKAIGWLNQQVEKATIQFLN